MAKYYSDGNYVVVESGDTLSGIAAAYKTQSGGKTYKQLANIKKNNISNPNMIHVGQKIYLTDDGSSGGTTTDTSNTPVVKQFGQLASDETGKTLFATWDWSKDQTASYKVLWTYETGDGIYFQGNLSTNTIDEDAPEMARQSTYQIPSGAKHVKFKFKPIAETETNNDKEEEVWKVEWSAEKTFDVEAKVRPEKPTTDPTIDIVDYKLIISLDKLDSEITSVDFRIYKDYGKNPITTKTGCEVTNGRASYEQTVSAGSAYTVQYRVVHDKLASDWSNMSSAIFTKPDAPVGITTIRASSEESVYLAWSAVNAANAIPNNSVSYEVQYATKLSHFEDNSDQVKDGPSTEFTSCDISGLETGNEYYFRVRATNEQGSSAWTEPKSVIVGSTPEPPTTWSSTTTAITGEDVILYWVHNSEDGSYQSSAKLELYIAGVKMVDELGDNYTFDNEDYENSVLKYTALSEKDLEDGKTHSCLLKTGQYAEGTEIKWQVKTAGITGVYSEWSTQRSVDIYAPPTMELTVLKRDGTVNADGSFNLVENTPSLVYTKTDTTIDAVNGMELSDTRTTTNEQVYVYVSEYNKVRYYCVVNSVYYLVEPSVAEGETGVITGFPFYVNAVTGPKTQAPIGYHLEIVSNSIYETVDNIGNPKTVSAGEQVYSQYFDTFQELHVEFTPGNIDLENNIEYTITCTASMDSGLSATQSVLFRVEWKEDAYEPNAAIAIDPDTLTASIRPYCNKYNVSYREVTKSGDEYAVTKNDLGYLYGERVGKDKTTTGEPVYQGVLNDAAETPVYFCVVNEVTPIDNVYLSVYRREFDGSFTELATDLDGALATTITDPHPSLDFARYRVVATAKTTGAVSYYDLPGHPVGEVAVIIQWDEAWTSFETDEESALEQPPWSGSLLRLPYNIDVSENVDPEVEMIEYIGRANPVSYYGTQRRQTATWNVVIEKSDKETVYALRRLANWMGDVYVREPSGVGYWAHVVVSFNQTHLEKTIPVTLTITRVEGGM